MLLFDSYDECFLYFRPIKSNKVAFDEWIEIKKDQSIIVLEEHDLTVAATKAAWAPAWWSTAAAAGALRVAAARSVATAAGGPAWVPAAGAARVAWVAPATWMKYNQTIEKVNQEIARTDKIKGYSALVVDKLVWISHYDVDALKESQ
jgi:hypothetical protein